MSLYTKWATRLRDRLNRKYPADPFANYPKPPFDEADLGPPVHVTPGHVGFHNGPPPPEIDPLINDDAYNRTIVYLDDEPEGPET